MRTKIYFLFSVSLFIIFSGCSSTKPSIKTGIHEVEVVESEGMGPIVEGNIEGAKKTSLHEAMRNALGLVVGVYVSQDALVSKAILIDENITSQTEGYIEKYEVLKEYRDGDFYKTRIRAHVRKEDLSAKLRNLETEPQRLGNPLIGFDIKESIDSKPTGTNYAELELKNKFVESGWTVSEKERANILIQGEVQSNFNTREGLGGFISYSATISLNAVKVDTGETIATAQKAEGGIYTNEHAASRAAIIRSAEKISEDLKDKILKYLKEKTLVHLTLSNVDSMNKLSEFIKSVRNIPLVRDCWLRDFSNGTAVMDIRIRKGNATNLSELLSKNTKFPLKILNTGTYKLEAQLE